VERKSSRGKAVIPNPNLNLRLAEAAAGTYTCAEPAQWHDAVDVVHVWLSMIDGVHCLAWEGTHTWEEWIVDFMALEVPFFADEVLGPVHLGMMRDVMAVIDPIYTYLASIGLPPYLNCGHSKGAGEAILFHAAMKARGYPPLATRAFEPPQVGGHVLRDYLSGEDIVWTATTNVHGRDLVVQVPFGPTWSHTSDPLLLTVPDSLDIPSKHMMASVLAALALPEVAA
jgi:hypothetical protein